MEGLPEGGVKVRGARKLRVLRIWGKTPSNVGVQTGESYWARLEGSEVSSNAGAVCAEKEQRRRLGGGTTLPTGKIQVGEQIRNRSEGICAEKIKGSYS